MAITVPTGHRLQVEVNSGTTGISGYGCTILGVSDDHVMRVPIVGLGVSIQRRWVRVPRPDQRIGLMWCGGQLHQNTLRAEQGCLRFIDNLGTEASPAGR